MANQLEHANIRVKSIDRTVEFLITAIPEFRVRGGGGSGPERWVHVGSDATYVALQEAGRTEKTRGPGLNHLGFVVDDWEGVRRRLEHAGFHESSPSETTAHRKRIYYKDGDGREWEFVEYHSDDPADRNEYL